MHPARETSHEVRKVPSRDIEGQVNTRERLSSISISHR
jgi:hypothetical protein